MDTIKKIKIPYKKMYDSIMRDFSGVVFGRHCKTNNTYIIKPINIKYNNYIKRWIAKHTL